MFRSVAYLMHTYTPHHLHSRYANGPADPHAVQESGHNIFLSKILPLMLGALVVMKAVGLRECRLLFQSFILQSVVEYTLLATPLECFITRQIPEVGSTPLSHTHTHTLATRNLHIMHVEDMRVNWMPFHLLGEQFDCIFNVGGYKQDGMSSQAAAGVAAANRVCWRWFLEVSDYAVICMAESLNGVLMLLPTWSPLWHNTGIQSHRHVLQPDPEQKQTYSKISFPFQTNHPRNRNLIMPTINISQCRENARWLMGRRWLTHLFAVTAWFSSTQYFLRTTRYICLCYIQTNRTPMKQSQWSFVFEGCYNWVLIKSHTWGTPWWVCASRCIYIQRDVAFSF